MILILVAIIVSMTLAVVMMHYGTEGYLGRHAVVFGLGMVLAAAAGVTAVAYAFVAWEWFASEQRAKIINREYGTNYTREEVFWASDVIDTVRELDRKRVEVNGNVFTGQPETTNE